MVLVKRVGILGGTFDPPHLGHLILGEYARDALQLTHMLFVPAGDPPHKQAEAKTPIEHRLAMLKLALSDNEHFQISRTDIDRPGPHYSVDMVRIIQDTYPGAEVYFVMGGDSLRDLPKWYRPQEFIRLCKLAVIRRPGDTASPQMHEGLLPGLAERVTMIDSPLIDISGFDIRARVCTGRSIRYLVPESVRDYIHMNQLYNL
jgi:nicotinate-nucleotide adenylyltransferase